MTSAPIIVPAFNRGRSLYATLNFLRAQNLDEYEVVIVDDGSLESALLLTADFDAGVTVRVVDEAGNDMIEQYEDEVDDAWDELVEFLQHR